MNKIIRTFDKTGRVNDGLGGIKPGDVFITSYGKLTKPYPKKKSSRYTTEWLVNEAIEEAKRQNNDFLLFQLENISFLKETKNILELTTADSVFINQFLFG